jgi:hypothetical protein
VPDRIIQVLPAQGPEKQRLATPTDRFQFSDSKKQPL